MEVRESTEGGGKKKRERESKEDKEMIRGREKD